MVKQRKLKKKMAIDNLVANHPVAEAAATPNWCMIPNEILAMIFSNLDVKEKQAVALVCTGWRGAVYLPFLWRTATVSLGEDCDKALVSSLAIRGVRQVSANSEQSLQCALLNMPNLEHLDLSRCHPVNDHSVTSIGLNLKNLTFLNLSGCNEVTDSSLLTVSTCLSKLKHLDLTCASISDVGVACIASQNLPLEVLVLCGCFRLTDAGIKHLSWDGSQIQHLDVSYCERLTDEGIAHVAKIRKLDRLVISAVRLLTDGALLALSTTNVTQLSVGNLKHLTELGANYLSRMPRLQILQAYWDPISAAIASFGDASMVFLGSMSSLRELHLTGTDVSDEGLAHLAGSRITRLNLQNCINVTDVGMEHVARMEHLSYLNVMGCTSLSVRGLKLLVEMGSHITHLDADGCSWSRPTCFKVLVKLPFLSALDLGLDRTTNARLAQLVKAQSKIVTLNIYNSHISDVGVRHLAKLNNLREVNLYDAVVTDAGMAFLDLNGKKVNKISSHT